MGLDWITRSQIRIQCIEIAHSPGGTSLSPETVVLLAVLMEADTWPQYSPHWDDPKFQVPPLPARTHDSQPRTWRGRAVRKLQQWLERLA